MNLDIADARVYREGASPTPVNMPNVKSGSSWIVLGRTDVIYVIVFITGESVGKGSECCT